MYSHTELYVAALSIIEILEKGRYEFLHEGIFIKSKKYFPKTTKNYFTKNSIYNYYECFFKGKIGIKKYISATKMFEREFDNNFNTFFDQILKKFVIPPFNNNVKFLYQRANLQKCKTKAEIYSAIISTLCELTGKEQRQILCELSRTGGVKIAKENKDLVRRLEEVTNTFTTIRAQHQQTDKEVLF